MNTRIAGLLTIIFVLGTHEASAQTPRAQAPAVPPAQPLILPWQYVGVAGCGRRGCHNDQKAADHVARTGEWMRGGETSHWLRRDRHARAYDVLATDESRQMARNLGLRQPPTEAALCLDCHALNPPPGQRGEKYSLTMGVSCESCHGPAQHWLAIHTGNAWKRLPPEQKARYGFRNLTSIDARVETCAHCHVGDSNRSVNHDLLAAGHPPLEFEAASFHDRQPKHWDVPGERERDPLIQPRLWLAGQAASAAALARVVASQAEGGVWPEFAYYNCSSCHHRLTGSAAAIAADEQRKAGQVEWGRWQVRFADIASRRFQNLDPQVRGPLQQIQDGMQFYAVDRREASRQAALLAQGFEGWAKALGRRRLTREDAYALLRSVLENDAGDDPATLRERFLAVRALSDFDSARLRNAAFEKLITEFDRPDVNPRPLDPRAAAEALDAVRGRLPRQAQSSSER